MSTITPISPGLVLGANTNLFAGITISEAMLGFLKLGFLFGFGMLLLFSILVVRQISLMNSTLTTPLEGRVKFLGYAFFAACSVAFIAAFVIL